MPTVQVTGLNVVSIYVSDLEIAEAFYRDHLGFQRCEEMPPGILMKTHHVTIYLEPNRGKRTTSPHSEAEVGPCFACDSVKAASEALLVAGQTLVMNYQEFSPHFAMFQIQDPDGNLIEFAGKP